MKFFRNIICFLSLAVLFHNPNMLSAQQPSVLLSSEKKEFQIGEQIELQLEINVPVEQDAVFPSFKDTLTRTMEIISLSAVDTIFPDDDVTLKIFKQSLIITSFDTGFHVIPPISFTVAGNAVSTSPLLLQVTLPSVDEQAEIKDIKPPIHVGFSILEWLFDHWKWILGLYVLIGLVLLYWKLFLSKPKKKKETPVIQAPKIPYDQEALDQLAVIEEKKLWQSGHHKQYYSEITEVIRNYIERRYHVHALEQTSDEIFANLRHIEMTEETRNQLRKLLFTADMVKFAKEKPVATENEAIFRNSIEFIQSTRPSLSAIEINEDQPSQ